MLSVKDYVNLRNIYYFLCEKRHTLMLENNMNTSAKIEVIGNYIDNLENILEKLEEE